MRIRISYDWHDRSWDVDSGETLEGLELESIESEIYLERFGSMYMVSSFSHHLTVFHVSDSRDEAYRSFKYELAYLLYEVALRYDEVDEGEIREAEKVLMNYGFLSDMKMAYRLLEELGGKAELSKIDDLVESKYPHYNRTLVHLALQALRSKGYIKAIPGGRSIVRELDF